MLRRELLQALPALAMESRYALAVSGANEQNAANNQRATSVKFRLIGPGAFLIVVPVRINGHGPFEFGFDTGGAHTSLSAELAKRLQLQVADAGESFGFGSAVHLQATTLGSIQVGDVVGHKVKVGVADFSPFSANLGESVDGILAHDFFGHFVVTIDYPNKVLKLAN